MAAIESALGTEADEYGATLFASHHLEEIEPEYWLKHLKKTKPEHREIVRLLKLKCHWSSDNESGLDVFDFELPDEISNYVVSVRFNARGEVDEISMES